MTDMPPPPPPYVPPAVTAPAPLVQPSPSAKGPSRKRPVMIVAAVAIALVGVGGVYVATKSDSSSSTAASAARSLPATAESQWSTDFDGYGSAQSDGTTVYVTETDQSDVSVSALDARSGDERWNQRLSSATYAYVGVITTRGVVVRSSDDNSVSLALLDAKDGSEVWTLNPRDAGLIENSGLTYLATSSGGGEGGGGSFTELQLIDLATGKKGKRATADRSLTFSGNRVIAFNDKNVEILQASSLEMVGDAIKIDRDTTSVAVLDGRLIAAVGDRISAIAADGTELWVDDSPVNQVYGLHVQNGKLFISGDKGVAAVAIGGDGLEELWNADGYFYGGAAGSRLVAVDANKGELAMLDESTGVEACTIDGEFQSESGPWQVFDNGVLVSSYDSNSSRLTTEAFSLPSGDSMWAIDDAYITVGKGWLVGVESNGDNFTVSFYR